MKRRDNLYKKEEQPKVKPVKEKKPGKAKEESYVLRKNAGMRILRVILWVMLTFIFIRGLVSIFKLNSEERANLLINDFKAQFSEVSNQNAEVMSFAQNFVKEYLTYEVKGEEDYRSRLEPYLNRSVLNSALNDFKKSATAVYVQAYRIEEYSPNQMDVYVLAEVEYTSRSLSEDGQTYTTESTLDKTVLSVPVYVAGGKYIVESIPLMVSDSMYLDDYKVTEYSGTTLEDTQAAEVKTSVENFLKAYYEQDESVINYYLSSGADKTAFKGHNGRFTFSGIETIKCYREEGQDIICLVEYQIQDADNQAEILQRINLSVQENGGKYYIRSMDTRTGNLNIY